MKNHEISSTLWNGNSKKVRGVKLKCPPSKGGGKWIFSGTTQCILSSICNCKSKHFEIFCRALDYIAGGHGFDSGPNNTQVLIQLKNYGNKETKGDVYGKQRTSDSS